MKNTMKAGLALMVVMMLPGIMSALTQYGAPEVNVKLMNGNTVNTGAGNAASGTQRVILATDQPTLPVSFTGTSTGTVNVGQWGGTATSLGQKQKSASVPVTIASDQDPMPIALDGSTVAVTNVAGQNLNTNIDSVGGTQVTLGAKTGSASIPVVLPTDLQPFVIISTTVGTPQQHNVTATGVSATLVPANTARVGIECDTDCANNKNVYLGFGGAATTAGKVIPPCSSWTPPPGLRFTSSVTVIAESGSQVVRCVEY